MNSLDLSIFTAPCCPQRRWCLTLILSAGASLACVSSDGASLAIGNARGYPGQVATVPFIVRQATNVVAAQFDLAFNTAKGTLNPPILVGRNSNAVIRSREIAPGVRRVVVYTPNNTLLRTNGFSGSFTYNVPVGERVGSGPITPQNPILARSNGERITPATTSSGTVFVSPLFRDPESGLVDLFFPSTPEQPYLLQATEDFVHWINISTNLATSDFIDLVDRDAPIYPYRFYRTAELDALGTIALISRAQNGSVTLQVSGRDGRTYVIQGSTDLVIWQDLATRSTVGGSIQYTDNTAVGLRQRFYRLKSQP